MKRASACLILAVLSAVSLLADPLPRGWHLAGNRPQDYMTGTDTSVAASGKSSGYLASRPGIRDDDGFGRGFGTVMQTVSADDYRGKRVRFRASVKATAVTGWAGLWMRVDGKDLSRPLGFDNMQGRPIKGTSGWTTYDVILDVPQESADVAFGILLSGKGQVWIDDASLEPVADAVPTTGGSRDLPRTPLGLDFESQ